MSQEYHEIWVANSAHFLNQMRPKRASFTHIPLLHKHQAECGQRYVISDSKACLYTESTSIVCSPLEYLQQVTSVKTFSGMQ